MGAGEKQLLERKQTAPLKRSTERVSPEPKQRAFSAKSSDDIAREYAGVEAIRESLRAMARNTDANKEDRNAAKECLRVMYNELPAV